MIEAPIRRKRHSVATRILATLQGAEGQPLHYTRIAQRLHHPKPHYVLNICVQMAHRGLLQWIAPGTYRLRPWGV